MADDFRNQTESIAERKEAQRQLFLKIKEIAKEKNISIIMKRINIGNPDEALIHDFLETGMMITMGKNDQDSYNKHKTYKAKRS